VHDVVHDGVHERLTTSAGPGEEIGHQSAKSDMRAMPLALWQWCHKRAKGAIVRHSERLPA
jgi:hypothetical protein